MPVNSSLKFSQLKTGIKMSWFIGMLKNNFEQKDSEDDKCSLIVPFVRINTKIYFHYFNFFKK